MSRDRDRDGFIRGYLRPGLWLVLGLVLVVGGCVAIESAALSGPETGYTAGAPATPAAQPMTGAPSPLPTRPNTPTWSGTVQVTGKGVEIDTQPPAGVAVVGGDAAIQFDGSNLVVYGSSAGYWTAAADPTYEQCLQLVETQPIASGTISGYAPERGWCVLNTQRTAMGFFRGTGNPSPGGVEMNAIRWAVQ